MRPLPFAWRSLSRQPARAVLGLAGITVVGALLFDMLMLSRGLLLSFREILESTGYDVRVTATDALPGLGPPIAEARAAARALGSLPEVADVVPVRFGSVSVRGADGRTASVALLGTETRRRGEWRVLRGSDLVEGTEPPSIVVNRAMAQELGAEPGAVVEVATVLPAQPFRVAGVVEFPFETAGEASATVTLDGFARAVGGVAADEADLLLVASRPGHGAEAAVAAIRAARADLHPFSTEQVLERLRQGEFSYFRQVSFVLSTITSFFAFLLVTTLLTVSVNQRLGEVAALRALGFPRRRIAADLFAESALLVGAGGALAIPLGLALARVLDAILRQMPDVPARLHFFVFEPRALALHAALLAGACLVAAAYPALLTARLPIAATLRRETLS
ncbi:MAG TPA: ABC transporter permease [Vicinamibacteria bacterium]